MFVRQTEKLINHTFVCVINMTNNELEESLKRNIKNFKNSADLVYAQKNFTSATVLYFKSLFSILDFIILKEKGFIPKDHSERFRILEKDFPSFYEIIDKYFSICQEPSTKVANVFGVLEHTRFAFAFSRVKTESLRKQQILMYQESYKKSIDREVCDKVKENVERFIKEQKI